MTHHPHLHMIVPGGGVASGGTRWVSSRHTFLFPVRALGKLFRRLFLTRLTQLYDAGKLALFGSFAPLGQRRAFLNHIAPVRKKRWVVYAKPSFAGPEAVLAYLSRYTHRVAISNRRILAFDGSDVTLCCKDYRKNGADRQRVMKITADEFIRRFLLHVLPRSFHRIRHYGLLAGSNRKVNLALAREPLQVAPEPEEPRTTSRRIRVRYVRAAAATWSSSRPLSAGGNRVYRRQRHRLSGNVGHDPACPVRLLPAKLGLRDRGTLASTAIFVERGGLLPPRRCPTNATDQHRSALMATESLHPHRGS